MRALPTFRAGAPGLTALVLSAALLAPAPAAAQDVTRLGPATAAGEPRLQGGATLVVAQPVGEFADYIANGIGVGGHGLVRLGAAGAFAFRLDGGYVQYGRETQRVRLLPTSGRVDVDLTTSNNIFWLGAGPQLMVPSGIVRPYVNGTAGFAYFQTQSTVEGSNNQNQPFASTTNFDDAVFQWGGGAGVLVPLGRPNRTIVFLDLGARYHANGEVSYLREGGITDLPNGGVQLNPIRSQGNLVTYHLGVSIGAR